ncbi:ROK family protein [Spirosoma sp. KUDC1026]|uniref:ROK family protein n=1 Tax=Spirosoma sp. KUDC1026 TaxID=2745947 RepID=UPI00159BB248|nr:ROK family protein [Spirosoma sp. KUDC1026]QKZ12657.1 ROK family protein [Spirosoma sp. KUDC1026]
MENKAVIAIDLGGTRIKLGLVRAGSVLLTDRMASQSGQGLQTRLPQIKATLDRMLETAGLSASDLVGMGVAVPGIVDPILKRVLSINDKYSDAPQLDLAGWARETWGIPLYLENDTRAALLGEWQYGSGQGYDNVVLMTLGTGVGTSAVIEGRLLRGKHFQAGILGGHFVQNTQGNRCNCGAVGCAEAEASTWSLGQRATAHKTYAQSLLCRYDTVDFEAVFRCAAQGDALATTLRDESIDVWATCAYNLVQAYDPEVLVLGGGVMASRDVIIPPIQHRLNQNTWATWGNVAVVPGLLTDSAALLGAAHLAYNREL